MYIAQITQVDKKIKKALQIPTPTMLKKSVLTIKELDGFMRNIAEFISDNGVDETEITFKIVEHDDDTKDKDVEYTFENIQILATDISEINPLVYTKIFADISEDEDATSEDYQLAEAIENQMTNDDTVALESDRPFDKKFSKPDKNQEPVKVKTTKVKTTEDEHKANADVFSDSGSNSNDDPFADPDDIIRETHHIDQQNDIDVSAINIDHDEYPSVTEANEVDTDKAAEIVQDNGTTSVSVDDVINYDDYVATDFENTGLVRFNKNRFSKKSVFRKYGLPLEKQDIDSDDILSQKKYEFLENQLNSNDIEGLKNEYIGQIDSINSDLRSNLSEYIKSSADTAALNAQVEEQLEQDLNEKNGQSNQQYTEFKSIKEQALNSEIEAIKQQAQQKKDAMLAQIELEEKTRLSTLNTEHQRVIEAEKDKIFKEIEQYESKRRQDLQQINNKRVFTDLINHKSDLIKSAEAKLNKINVEFDNKFNRDINGLSVKLDENLPIIEKNVLEEKRLNIEIENNRTTQQLKKDELELKKSQTNESTNSKSESPAVVVVPGQSSTQSEALNQEVIDMYKSILEKKYDEDKGKDQVDQPRKSYKLLVGTCVGLGLLSAGSMASTAVMINHQRNSQIENLQSKLESATNKANTNAQATVNSKDSDVTLDKLLQSRNYIAAYQKYQDNKSLDTIANTMFANEDTVALKAFNKKFGTNIGVLNEAILAGNKADIKTASDKLTADETKGLNYIQKTAIKSDK